MKKNWKRLILAAVLLLAVAGVVYNLAGCVSDAERAQTNSEAAEHRTYFTKLRNDANTRGDTDTAAYAQEQLDTLADAERKAETGINDDTEDLAPLLALAGAVPVVGVVGNILGRRWGKKRGYEYLVGVVSAFNKLREKEPQVAAAMTVHKDELNRTMGPAAAAAVKEIREKIDPPKAT